MTQRKSSVRVEVFNQLRGFVYFAVFLTALILAVFYIANLPKNSNSDPATKNVYSSVKSFGAAYTVSSTYTSKNNVIINNLWKPTTSISIGPYHGCAISNGQAYCWGYNLHGQLGNNSTANSVYPVAVDTSGVLSGKKITSIIAGPYHSCAIANGKVYCWGRNTHGQLGDNSTTQSSVPVAVDTSGVLSGRSITDISSGGTYGSTCVIADGLGFCWGARSYGVIGNGGSGSGNSIVPVAVSTSGVLAGENLTDISVGLSDHSCAIASGRAYCWGRNATGQLGNNSTTDSTVPVTVNTAVALAGKTVAQVSAGSGFTCAVADGGAYCWGQNGTNGRLGNNSTIDSSVPVAVDVSGVLAGKIVTYISSAWTHACAVADGDAFCWSTNTYGELGNGSTTASLVPVAVDTSGAIAGKNIAQVGTGLNYSCATANGRTYCWGRNDFGKLGNCTTSNTTIPYRVNDAYGVSTC